MSLLVLGTQDRDVWIALLQGLPPAQRDIHYHPDYLRIYERTNSETAHLVLWEGAGGTIFQPLVAREIPEADLCDLSSTYGYGGPLAIGAPTPEDVQGFTQGFASFAGDCGAVAEFCLLHPKLTQAQRPLLPDGQAVTYRKEVVVADLTQPLPLIWARIEERQRKAALAARKAGIEIVISDGSDADYDAYHTRYLETMRAVEARAFWHFPPDYFRNCRDCLGGEHVTLMHAQRDGQILASFFHIHMYGTVYYHFSCSDPAARKLNPTSLLMIDSLIWAKSAGYDLFHMGGGRTDGTDPLFTFKHAFSGQTLALHSTQRVLNAEAYDRLTAAAKLRETKAYGAPIETAFFPRYRLQS